MRIDGACHCGEVTFSAEIDPAGTMICHCTDCQVMSGAAFRVVVLAPLETFVVHGEPKSYVKVADSGSRRAQQFCATCGTPLYATAAEHPTSVSSRMRSPAFRTGTSRSDLAAVCDVVASRSSSHSGVAGATGIVAASRFGFVGDHSFRPAAVAVRGSR